MVWFQPRGNATALVASPPGVINCSQQSKEREREREREELAYRQTEVGGHKRTDSITTDRRAASLNRTLRYIRLHSPFDFDLI